MLKRIWEEYKEYRRRTLVKGLNDNKVFPYDEKLLKKLRNIYDGGIPASIILLSNFLSNGRCYDNAYLLSKAFLDTDDDVKLIYASIDSLRLNPDIPNDVAHTEHCYLERTMKNGKKLIYDTSAGYIFDKQVYFDLEHPEVRKINTKKTIQEFAKQEEQEYADDFKPNIIAAINVIPVVEAHYNDKGEKYSIEGVKYLQREVELFKKLINYDEVCKELGDKIKKLQIKVPDDLK